MLTPFTFEPRPLFPIMLTNSGFVSKQSLLTLFKSLQFIETALFTYGFPCQEAGTYGQPICKVVEGVGSQIQIARHLTIQHACIGIAEQ